MKNIIKTEASIGNNYTVVPTQADVFVLPLSEPLTDIVTGKQIGRAHV